MKHLVVQDWASTHGNHAGMVHMCQMLVDRWPDKYRLYVQKAPLRERFGTSEYRIYHNLQRKGFCWLLKCYEYLLWIIERKRLSKKLYFSIKEDDEVFLLEYMHNISYQLEMTDYIKSHFANVKIYALSHMTPLDMEKWTHEWLDISLWSEKVDKMMTLGSSLSNYLIKCGVPEKKIYTGFHYVDNNYYKPTLDTQPFKERQIAIVIGAMQRDYKLIAGIVKACPEIDWIICRGMKNIDSLLEGLNNVSLKGYLSEDDLKHQMDISDISVNVMNDTVGSNVITTSMAMGLAMVVSDVGSIRDYCDDGNAVFCLNTVDDFVNKIKAVVSDRIKLQEMQRASIVKSQSFSIDDINRWFNSLAK